MSSLFTIRIPPPHTSFPWKVCWGRETHHPANILNVYCWVSFRLLFILVLLYLLCWAMNGSKLRSVQYFPYGIFLRPQSHKGFWCDSFAVHCQHKRQIVCSYFMGACLVSTNNRVIPKKQKVVKILLIIKWSPSIFTRFRHFSGHFNQCHSREHSWKIPNTHRHSFSHSLFMSPQFCNTLVFSSLLVLASLIPCTITPFISF